MQSKSMDRKKEQMGMTDRGGKTVGSHDPTRTMDSYVDVKG